MDSRSGTYHGRLCLSSEQEAFLPDYATRYSTIERKLYADMRSRGLRASSFKNTYLVRFGITARQFNAIARNLEGKISSVLELLGLRKQELETRLVKAKKVLGKIRSSAVKHQKKRRLHILETKLAQINKQIQTKDPKICFGSRNLFRKQFHLTENRYVDHAAWRMDWAAKRGSQFYVLGSKDETAGCQGCAISANIDGTFNLRLRSLSKEARYIELENVSIRFGGDIIREALRNPQAISYRFLRDDKGWRVFVTTNLPEVKTRSMREAGAIGIDINADCLALSEIDRFGNLVKTKALPLITYGKSSAQAKALIGDAVKEIVALAEQVGKPLVIEKLDFSKKKAELEKEDPTYARMLSSLSYNTIIQGLKTRAYKVGIEVVEVNPAYTSIIGLVNHSRAKGMSVHQAAAFAIARRGCGFRERSARGEATVPTPKGDHVTFCLPVRNRRKHVWSFWSDVKKTHAAVLAAHFRPPERDPSRPRSSKRKSPIFTVKPRNANRQQNCSAGVMEDHPW